MILAQDKREKKEKKSIAWESHLMKAVKGIAAFWERDWNLVSRFSICNELALHANKLGTRVMTTWNKVESRENPEKFH